MEGSLNKYLDHNELLRRLSDIEQELFETSQKLEEEQDKVCKIRLTYDSEGNLLDDVIGRYRYLGIDIDVFSSRKLSDMLELLGKRMRVDSGGNVDGISQFNSLSPHAKYFDLTFKCYNLEEEGDRYEISIRYLHHMEDEVREFDCKMAQACCSYLFTNLTAVVNRGVGCLNSIVFGSIDENDLENTLEIIFYSVRDAYSFMISDIWPVVKNAPKKYIIKDECTIKPEAFIKGFSFAYEHIMDVLLQFRKAFDLYLQEENQKFKSVFLQKSWDLLSEMHYLIGKYRILLVSEKVDSFLDPDFIKGLKSKHNYKGGNCFEK